MSRGGGAGGRNRNRSRRARLASRHFDGAASVISPAYWAARTGDDPRSAKLLDASPFRARRLCHVPGGIFPLGRGAGASRRASGATQPCRKTRLSLRSAALDPPGDRTTDRGVQPIMPRRRLRPFARTYNRSWRATGAARRVGGAASVMSLAHRAARTGNSPMSATLLVAAPFRARRLRYLPASIFPVGRSAQASRRASGARLPSQQTRLSHRSAALDLPSGHITDHGGPRGPRATLAVSPRFVRRRSLAAQTAGNRMPTGLPNTAPRWASLPRHSPGGISPLRLDGGQGRRTRWATWLPSQARH